MGCMYVWRILLRVGMRSPSSPPLSRFCPRTQMVGCFTLTTSTGARSGSGRRPPSPRGRGRPRWTTSGGGKWHTPWLVGIPRWRLAFQWPVVYALDLIHLKKPSPSLSLTYHPLITPLSPHHTLTCSTHTHSPTPSHPHSYHVTPSPPHTPTPTPPHTLTGEC